MEGWDKEVDILVVGSGAGGMLSALVAAEKGASTLIIEKEKLWGGTSATSGAGIWIPASDQAKAEGFGDKPPVAYRALDFLVEQGFAHRIESLNAFVACMHPAEGHDPAFMICRNCRAVAETIAGDGPIAEDAAEIGFKIETTVVEAEGLCPKCQIK